MEKEKYQIMWYRLRGLGLICLCSLVFFIGAHLANQQSVTVSTVNSGQTIPLCSVQTEEKKAALTFDAAWNDAQTETILNILKTYEAGATFFVTGEWADRYPESVQAIAASGQELGNLGQSHSDMRGMTEDEIQNEIETVHEKVKQLTGMEMELFRAPYGDYNDTVTAAAEKSGYLPVLYDVDSEDWKDYGVESILRSVVQNPELGSGSIILMHIDANYTAQALESVITNLQSQGYALVTVSDLMG